MRLLPHRAVAFASRARSKLALACGGRIRPSGPSQQGFCQTASELLLVLQKTTMSELFSEAARSREQLQSDRDAIAATASHRGAASDQLLRR